MKARERKKAAGEKIKSLGLFVAIDFHGLTIRNAANGERLQIWLALARPWPGLGQALARPSCLRWRSGAAACGRSKTPTVPASPPCPGPDHHLYLRPCPCREVPALVLVPVHICAPGHVHVALVAASFPAFSPHSPACR